MPLRKGTVSTRCHAMLYTVLLHAIYSAIYSAIARKRIKWIHNVQDIVGIVDEFICRNVDGNTIRGFPDCVREHLPAVHCKRGGALCVV
jgi:hypothetical protein